MMFLANRPQWNRGQRGRSLFSLDPGLAFATIEESAVPSRGIRMSPTLICPNGHHWEISHDSRTEVVPSPVVCPICGQTVALSAATVRQKEAVWTQGRAPIDS